MLCKYAILMIALRMHVVDNHGRAVCQYHHIRMGVASLIADCYIFATKMLFVYQCHVIPLVLYPPTL